MLLLTAASAFQLFFLMVLTTPYSHLPQIKLKLYIPDKKVRRILHCYTANRIQKSYCCNRMQTTLVHSKSLTMHELSIKIHINFCSAVVITSPLTESTRIKLLGYKCKHGYDGKCTQLNRQERQTQICKITQAAYKCSADTTYIYIKHSVSSLSASHAEVGCNTLNSSFHSKLGKLSNSLKTVAMYKKMAL